MAKNIVFNSFDLQDSNFLTKDIIYRNIPSKIIDLIPKSRRDGFFVQNTYYESKEIVVRGTISRDTEANLKTSLDTMKEALYTDEANLDIDDGSGTMRFVASVQSINIPEEHYHITQLPFEIVFIAQPFGRATSTTTDTNSGITASPENSSIDPTGSIGPRPILKWLLAALPSAAITQIKFENTTTSESITIPSLVLDASGDYLIVDCENMTVERSYDGGAETDIDFTGIFPSFIAGSNSYTLTITCGGTFNITQTIEYTPLYL